MLLPRKTVAVGEDVSPASSEVLPWQVVERFIERAGFLWVMTSASAGARWAVRTTPWTWAASSSATRQGTSTPSWEAGDQRGGARAPGAVPPGRAVPLVGRNRVDAYG